MTISVLNRFEIVNVAQSDSEREVETPRTCQFGGKKDVMQMTPVEAPGEVIPNEEVRQR
jgi:hypothetical protein